MSVLKTLSSGWQAWVLLALITLGAALPGLVLMPALDRDESRFAQASKQMLETGDYIRIRYQDEGRNKKPAGIHWLQAGSVALASDPAAGQIWPYRLPSLIGAIAATLATFWCGLVLVGRRASFLGAALFGSGLLLTSEAHIAKTDAVLVALTVIAMGALARLIASGDRGQGARTAMVFVFWAALGASFLIKGPVSMLVAGLAIAALSLVRRDLSLVRPVFDWRAIGLFFALVLPWFIWVQIATGGEFLEGAVGKDLKDKLVGASEGHGGPPGYHLAFLATHFFPATIVLVPALVLAFRTLRGRALDTLAAERAGLVFLAAWLVPTWIFFEFLPTKLSHYILPAYPALALVCGWGLVKLMGQARAPVSGAVSLVVFGVAAIGLAVLMSPIGLTMLQSEAAGDFRSGAPASAVLASWVPYGSGAPAFLLAGLAASAGAVLAMTTRRIGAGVFLAILSGFLTGWHIRAVALPGAVWLQPTGAARLALADACALPQGNPEACAGPAPARVQAVGYAEPSLVFTTGTNTVIPPQTIVALPEDDSLYPQAWLFNVEAAAGASALVDLRTAALAARRCVRASEPAYALNYSNGDPVAFVALRIEAMPCS